jgi:hypothetical protein
MRGPAAEPRSSPIAFAIAVVWFVVVLSGVIQYLIYRTGLSLYYPFIGLFLPYFAIFRLPQILALATKPQFWLWTLTVFVPVVLYFAGSNDADATLTMKTRIIYFSTLAGSALMLIAPDARRILRVASLIVLSWSIPICFVELVIPNLLSTAEGRAAGLYGNPNDASMAMLVCLLLAIDVTKQTSRSLVLLSLGVAAVFATFSRSGMLFASALWAWYSLAPGSRTISGGRRIVVLGAIAFVAVLAIAWVSQNVTLSGEAAVRLRSFFGADVSDASSVERAIRASYSLDLFLSNPLGNGMGYVERISIRPHNTYLHLAIDYGVFGLALYLAILLSGLTKAALVGWRRGANSFLVATLLIYSGLFTHYVAGTTYFTVAFAALAVNALILAPEPARATASRLVPSARAAGVRGRSSA